MILQGFLLLAVFEKFGVSGPGISRSSPIDHFLKKTPGKLSLGFSGFGKHKVKSTFGFSGLRKHNVKSIFGISGLQLLADSLSPKLRFSISNATFSQQS